MIATPQARMQNVKERNREILRCFCVSIVMLLIPWGFVLLISSLGIRNKQAWFSAAFFVLWLVSGIFGLLYGVRALRLSDRKTDGFGILALFLHAGSMILLVGFVAAASYPAE